MESLILEAGRTQGSALCSALTLIHGKYHDDEVEKVYHFLYKNYKIHPSELITAIVALIALIVMVLDGCNIIASFVCFILPLAGCLKELAVSEEKRRLNFVKINASDQNSRLTDE